jgi:3',5'-cyclic AMP phosphodiesterase CpdA
VDLTIGLVTDLHFGPEARFAGKLRKLTAQAPSLLRAFVERMNHEVRPDVVVNLGDDLEDEGLEADRARYREVMDILGGLEAPVLHVAGNHDTVHLSPEDLVALWGKPAGSALYYARDIGGYHLVVLHTQEVKDVSVSIDEAQLAWLAEDLAAANGPVIVLMHHSAADQHLAGNRWFSVAPHICLVRERARLRQVLEASGKVLAVFNGHLHWNHLDVIGSIPYVTLQSLIENLDDDAPGRPAAAHAVVRITPRRLLVEVEGAERARYQFARPARTAG